GGASSVGAGRRLVCLVGADAAGPIVGRSRGGGLVAAFSRGAVGRGAGLAGVARTGRRRAPADFAGLRFDRDGGDGERAVARGIFGRTSGLRRRAAACATGDRRRQTSAGRG